MKVNRNGIWGVLLVVAGLFSVIRLHGNVSWLYFSIGTIQYVIVHILMEKCRTTLSSSKYYRVGNHLFYSLIIGGLFLDNFVYLKNLMANGHFENGDYQNTWFVWYLGAFIVGVVFPGLYDFLVRAYYLQKWQIIKEILLIIFSILWTITISVHILYIPILYLLLAIVHTVGIRWLKPDHDLLKWGNYMFYILAIGFMLFEINEVLILAMFYLLAVVLGYGIPKMLFPDIGEEKV